MTSSPASADNNRLIAAVNARLVDVHAKRLAELGAEESGLFEHYARLLEDGAILRTTDIEAFKLVREKLPAFNEYVVLKAGLGELALLLEQAGLRVIACEKNARRFMALTASCDRGSSAAGDSGLRLVENFLPDNARNRPALGIATDFAYNVLLENDDVFRRGLRQFDALLVNPRLFIRVRNSQPEQRAVVTFVRSLGFTEITDFPVAGLLFAARPAGRAGDEIGSILTTSIGPEFNALLERIMALVPEPLSHDPASTWVERRIRKFDMKSAFGNGE